MIIHGRILIGLDFMPVVQVGGGTMEDGMIPGMTHGTIHGTLAPGMIHGITDGDIIMDGIIRIIIMAVGIRGEDM